MTLPILKLMSILKVLIYVITRIAALPIRLDAILVIMSVSTFKTVIILYLPLIIDEHSVTYLVDLIDPEAVPSFHI